MTHPWALGVMIVIAFLVATLGWMIIEEFRGPRPAKPYDYYEAWLNRADSERQLDDSK